MSIGSRQPTSNEELLQMAIRAAKEGQTEGARMMLRQVYSRNKNNETALVWLAKLATTEQERREWLKLILEVNPENTAAEKALKKLDQKQAASDNRTLLIFGALAAVMFVVIIAVVVVVFIT